MCGIVAALSERPVTSILLAGLRRLEYRGYDSAGIAVIGAGSTITKNVMPQALALSRNHQQEIEQWAVRRKQDKKTTRKS